MIDATEAVKIAEQKLPQVVPAFAALHPAVEEVERSDDGRNWLITFRARNPEPGSEAVYSFMPFVEKVVRLEAVSGALLAVLNPSYR